MVRLSSLRRQQGGEIVEFLVILPFVLIVFFMILDLGIGFVNQGILVNASRAAAREAIRCSDITADECQDAWEAAADEVAQSLIAWSDDANPSAQVTLQVDDDDARCNSPAQAGCPLIVDVTYSYDYLLVSAFIPGLASNNLVARTTMPKLID
jgi:Flp pilus assembly protein TadG